MFDYIRTYIRIYYKTALIHLLSFIIFTVLVKTVNVKPYGPEGSLIGFSTVNTAVFNLFGEHKFFKSLTEIIGYLAIFIGAIFAFLGFLELCKVRNIFKVNNKVLILGVFYTLVIITYVLFEILKINYRPILEDGNLEASYPSSHTALVLCIMATAPTHVKSYISDKTILKVFRLLSYVFMAFMVFGRLISGEHWFTDIIGGILLSCTLISAYYGTLKLFDNEFSGGEQSNLNRNKNKSNHRRGGAHLA